MLLAKYFTINKYDNTGSESLWQLRSHYVENLNSVASKTSSSEITEVIFVACWRPGGGGCICDRRRFASNKFALRESKITIKWS